MSFRTSPIVIGMRNVARSLGLTRLIAKGLLRGSYEEAFDTALMGAIRTGDVIWDVGANVGLYSLKFAERAGAGGRVYAFEPSPINLERLREAASTVANVTVVAKGLADTPATMQMAQGDDTLGASSRILTGEGEGTMAIQVETGDRIVEQGEAVPPNMVKIDVEGFELEVLRGMTEVLRDPSLRAVCVEVHFQQLKDRGSAGTPREIEQLLTAAGFAVRWTDASHLVGSR